MKVNVSNMPLNTVYKFGENSYVWSIMQNNNKITEVYRIEDDGLMKKIASGKLLLNPDNDYDRFAIYDLDEERNLIFFVEGKIEEANLEELYRLQKSIYDSYEGMKK